MQPRTKRRAFNVHNSLVYRTATGLCPVCRKQPANRATCGSNECVSLWTIGHVPEYYQNEAEEE